MCLAYHPQCLEYSTLYLGSQVKYTHPFCVTPLVAPLAGGHHLAAPGFANTSPGNPWNRRADDPQSRPLFPLARRFANAPWTWALDLGPGGWQRW
jgi:hypothetical protein